MISPKPKGFMMYLHGIYIYGFTVHSLIPSTYIVECRVAVVGFNIIMFWESIPHNST